MMKTILLLACGWVLSCGSLFSAIITYSSAGGSVYDASNALAETGDLVRLGHFTDGFNFLANQNNLLALEAAFTEYGSSYFLADGLVFDTANFSTIQGQELYLWTFNEVVAGDATQWGVFGNASWIAPGDVPPVDTTFIDIGDSGTYALIGSMIGNDGHMVAVVPEPSTALLLLLGTGVIALFRHCRKTI